MRSDKGNSSKIENDSILKNDDKDDHFTVFGDLELNSIIESEFTINCCRFSPDGDIFAIGCSDGTIKIYKKHNCMLIYALVDDDTKRTRLPVTCIKFFNPPNDANADHLKIIIASYVSGHVKFWHYPTKKCVYTIFDKEIEPLTIDFNHSFDRMVVGGYLDKLKVFDVETKKLVNTLESNGFGGTVTGHTSRVYCVKYNPRDKNQIFSGGWDDTVQVWDDRLENSVNYIYGPHICGDAIDVDSNHNHLLTGSWRKMSTLQIWDLRNYDLIRDVFKNKSTMMIYGCQWVGSSQIYTCGSEKNSALVYDRGTLKPIGGFTDLPHAVSCIDNDHVGEFSNLLACSQNRAYFLGRKTLGWNTTNKTASNKK